MGKRGHGRFARRGSRQLCALRLAGRPSAIPQGFFSETLPKAPIQKLSILRVDADLYQSTLDVLQNLYGKLSPGGYAIFDDYQNLLDCRRAIDEFRQENGISEEILPIDGRAVYWQKRA